MAISLGDAVYNFLGKTDNLDQAFAELPGKAEKSFGAAAAFNKKFNDELDATGENVRFAGEKILSLTDAFRTLSIQGPERLKQKLEDAKNAFSTLQSAGVTASGTILQAQAKVIEREIAYRAALGESTVALNAELAALKAESVALGGSLSLKENLAAATRALALSQQSATVATEEQATAAEVLSGAYKGLLGAVTSLLAAGFFVHFLEQTAKSIDEIDDLSVASGLAVTQIVGLKNAMKESGDNSDRLGQQLAKIASGLVQAEAGSAQQRQAFQALGVEFDSVTGKAPALFDALLQIADHLHETGASGDTLGLAFKALGKNSVELISFLSQGSAAIQEQMGHYKELGDQVQKTVDAGAEFQRLEAQIGADIESLLLPAFRLFVEGFRTAAAAIIYVQGRLENIGRAIELSIQLFGDLSEGLVKFHQAATSLDFSGVQQSFKKTLSEMRDDIALASIDIENTTKKAAADAAKFLGDIPKQAPKLSLQSQIVPDENANKVVEEAKRALDAQLATIEEWKAGVHLAFAAGQVDAAEWQATQVRAADAADQAQERYLSRLIVGYQQAGEVQKAQAAIQELATLKVKDAAKETDTLATAIQKHNEAALKMVIDWQNLQNQNIAKSWQDATKAAEELVKSENKLHEAQTKLAEAQVARDFAKQIQDVQDLAEVGVISQGQATEQLRAIYQQQEKEQLDHLQILLDQQTQTAAISQQKLVDAKDNPFFSDAQVSNLKKNLDDAATAIANTQTQIVNIQAAADARVSSLDRALLRQATQSWQAYFRLIVTGSLSAGQALRAMSTMFVNAIGASVQAAVMGSQSFGQAMLSMLKSALAALAGESVVEALKQLAKGFSALADPFTAHLAPGYFLAAAKWGAVGAAAAIAGAAVPSGSSGAGSSPSAPVNLPATPATTGGGGGTGPNVPHLDTGGLISRETLALIHANEAVIPLNDTRAIDRIAGPLGDRIVRSLTNVGDYSRSDIADPHPPNTEDILQKIFGGNKVFEAGLVQNHFHVKGNLVDLSEVVRQSSRLVKKGRVRSTASVALQVTKRA